MYTVSKKTAPEYLVNISVKSYDLRFTYLFASL